MFPDIRIVWLVRREQNKDLVREAERARLRRAANAARPRLLARVAAGIGRFLLSAGKELQERYTPVKTGLTVSQSPCKPTTRPADRPGS